MQENEFSFKANLMNDVFLIDSYQIQDLAQ